jgi:hypothetical protein
MRIDKLDNYLIITCIVDDMLRAQETLKKTRIKQYNTVVLQTLSYCSENWTIKATDARRITAAEVKYMRKAAGYSLADRNTNTQITKELDIIIPVLDRKREYRRNRLQHVDRILHYRLPRIIPKKLQINRQKKPEETVKRFLDV